MNDKVDEFLLNEIKWKQEFMRLRQIISDCHLVEEFKWSKPCYTLEGKNVLIIHGFKDYCAILFIKGSLLNDKQGVLVQQTQNVQAGRQMRFKSLEEIIEHESYIKEYIQNAIEVEKAGGKVVLKPTTSYIVPDEMEVAFAEFPELKSAFEKLTPGRQRGYLLKISEPKQSKTRIARINKYMEHILAGKGLNDK